MRGGRPPDAGPGRRAGPSRLAVGAAGSDAGRRRPRVAGESRSPAGAEDEPRRRRAAVEHLLDRLVDVVERDARRADTCVRPRRCSSKTSSRSWWVPTIEPGRSGRRGPSRRSGRCISFSAGRPTQTSVPPRRRRAEGLLERDRVDRGRDRGVGAAEALDRRDRVLLAGVHDVLGAELARRLEPLLVDVDGDDGGARDRARTGSPGGRGRRRRTRRRGPRTARRRP